MEEDDGENVFEIERILDTVVEKGVRYYCVHWKGYGEEEDTWEPERNLDDCEDVLKQFWECQKKIRKRGRKPKILKYLVSSDDETSNNERYESISNKRNCSEQPSIGSKAKNVTGGLCQKHKNIVDRVNMRGDRGFKKDLDSGILEALFSAVLPTEDIKHDNENNNIISSIDKQVQDSCSEIKSKSNECGDSGNLVKEPLPEMSNLTTDWTFKTNNKSKENMDWECVINPQRKESTNISKSDHQYYEPKEQDVVGPDSPILKDSNCSPVGNSSYMFDERTAEDMCSQETNLKDKLSDSGELMAENTPVRKANSTVEEATTQIKPSEKVKAIDGQNICDMDDKLSLDGGKSSQDVTEQSLSSKSKLDQSLNGTGKAETYERTTIPILCQFGSDGGFFNENSHSVAASKGAMQTEAAVEEFSTKESCELLDDTTSLKKPSSVADINASNDSDQELHLIEKSCAFELDKASFGVSIPMIGEKTKTQVSTGQGMYLNDKFSSSWTFEFDKTSLDHVHSPFAYEKIQPEASTDKELNLEDKSTVSECEFDKASLDFLSPLVYHRTKAQVSTGEELNLKDKSSVSEFEFDNIPLKVPSGGPIVHKKTKPHVLVSQEINLMGKPNLSELKFGIESDSKANCSSVTEETGVAFDPSKDGGLSEDSMLSTVPQFRKDEPNKEVQLAEGSKDSISNCGPPFENGSIPIAEDQESSVSSAIGDEASGQNEKSSVMPELSKIFTKLQKIKKKINIAKSSLPETKSTGLLQKQESRASSGRTCAANELIKDNPAMNESSSLIFKKFTAGDTNDSNMTETSAVEAFDKRDVEESKPLVDIDISRREEECIYSPPLSEEYFLNSMEGGMAVSSEASHSPNSSSSNFSLKRFSKARGVQETPSLKVSKTTPSVYASVYESTDEFSPDCTWPESSDSGEDSKKPLIIVLSEDSECEGEPERKTRKHTPYLNSGKPNGSHRVKSSMKERQAPDSIYRKIGNRQKENVYNCDVVSQIIHSSSSLKKSVKKARKDKNNQPKQRDSDMDLCNSDFEFDLDDYNPVELETKKTVKVNPDLHTRACVPSTYSLSDVKHAIKKGDCSTVLAALAGGLDIESQDGVVGMTLLMRAVSTWQDALVKILISRGANVNAKDNTGTTPLMLACELGMVSVATLLLDADADVNAKQVITGETALIKACKKDFYPIVSLLISYGADCEIRSQCGLTAAQTAINCGHYDIKDLLDDHNKKLQSSVESAIISCLGHESSLISPPLLPYVCLYPTDNQKFTYHFNCSNVLTDKTILLYCLRAVYPKNGEIKLSYSKDNGVHAVTLNGLLQTPVLQNNRSVFKLSPKPDKNRLVVETYQSRVHLVLCIYAADLNHDFLKIAQDSVMV